MYIYISTYICISIRTYIHMYVHISMYKEKCKVQQKQATVFELVKKAARLMVSFATFFANKIAIC